MDGLREVAVHHVPPGASSVQVGEATVACDCELGGRWPRLRRLAAYVRWLEGGRCDEYGRPADGELIRFVVDPMPSDRLADPDAAERVRQAGQIAHERRGRGAVEAMAGSREAWTKWDREQKERKRRDPEAAQELHPTGGTG